jgi:hypothetical protein
MILLVSCIDKKSILVEANNFLVGPVPTKKQHGVGTMIRLLQTWNTDTKVAQNPIDAYNNGTG